MIIGYPTMNSQTKRRKYWHQPQKRQMYSLEPGVRGFLCTCNNREKDCVRESYNLLNKYADQLYGSEKSKSEPSTVEATTDNVEDELEKELNELKADRKNVEKRRFQVVESGAKNILFVRTTLVDPVTLASTIVKDIQATKQSQTRFLIRLTPIEITCKAYIDDIKRACLSIFDKHFKENQCSFSIVYNHRNNNSLNKDEVIKEVADLVLNIRKDHVVNLTAPDISIIIEVIRGIALIAVIPNYMQYKKFNLLAFAETIKPEETKNENESGKEEEGG